MEADVRDECRTGENGSGRRCPQEEGRRAEGRGSSREVASDTAGRGFEADRGCAAS